MSVFNGYEPAPEPPGTATINKIEYDGGTIALALGFEGGAEIMLGVDARIGIQLSAILESEGSVLVAYEPWQVLRRRVPE